MEYEGRPVELTYLTPTDGWKDGTGTFIKWGSALDDRLGRPIQITFAVVEGPNGQVFRVGENNLKFTDLGPVKF